MDSQIISAIIGGVFAIVGIVLTHLLSGRRRSGSERSNSKDDRHHNFFEERSPVHRDTYHDDVYDSDKSVHEHEHEFWARVDRQDALTRAEFSRLRVGLFSLLSGFFVLGFDFFVLIFAKDNILELLPPSWGGNAIAIVCLGVMPVLGTYWIWTGISHLKK